MLAGAMRMRVGDGPLRVLEHRDTLWLADETLVYRIVHAPLEGNPTTQLHGGVQEPLRIVSHFDSVEIHRHDGVLTIGGHGARIISELMAIGGPVEWSTLARELWGRDLDRDDPRVRHRWDMALRRLRRRLRDAGIRADLVHPDGHGRVVLRTAEHDRVEEA